MRVAEARIEMADEPATREPTAAAPAAEFLIVRLSSIGDIVHALPAVAALGATYPSARISWIIEARYAGLLDGNPYLHRVLKVDTLGWRRRLVSSSALGEMAHSFRELRAVPFDAAVDFQGLIKSALLARLSHSRRRIGFEARWLRERLAGLFYTEKVAPGGGRHAIEENLALVERLGVRRPERFCFPLPRSEEAERAVAGRLEALGARDFAIVNPGGGWVAKRWSPQNYAALIRALQHDFSWPILLTGSPAEAGLIREVLAKGSNARASYFPSNLMEFIALARRARLFIGGDTGPLHLAAAAGTPIVAIYGPTDPARNGPFSPADLVLRAQVSVDHTRRAKAAQFIADVSVELVRDAVQKRLAVGGR